MYHADRSVVQVGIVGHNALELVLTIRCKETTQLLIPPAFLLLLPAFLVLKINIIIIAILILLLFVIIIIIKNIFPLCFCSFRLFLSWESIMITINLGWSNNSRPPHRQYLVKMETFLLQAICAQTSKATNP